MSRSPSNLPDDWNSYYRKCDRCGSRYHASEGGCGCLDNLEPCQCGECKWDGEEPRCTECGTGPFEEDTLRQVTTQVARKTYNAGRADEIHPGERYRKVTSRGHYPGGAWGPWSVSRKPVRAEIVA